MHYCFHGQANWHALCLSSTLPSAVDTHLQLVFLQPDSCAIHELHVCNNRPQCLCFTCRSRQEWSNYTWLDRIGVFFPIVNWVRKYNIKQNLLVSTATVAGSAICLNTDCVHSVTVLVQSPRSHRSAVNQCQSCHELLKCAEIRSIQCVYALPTHLDTRSIPCVYALPAHAG